MSNGSPGFAERIAPLVGILGVVGGSIWYLATLDARVKGIETQVQQLDTQVHTLTVAPFLANPSKSGTLGENSPTVTVSNPVAEACSKIALEIAEDLGSGKNVAMVPEKQLTLEKLGCLPRPPTSSPKTLSK